MNETPQLVSIIMPTYNRAELILQSIESVRMQTYSNWELIIVDDGSEDNTEQVVSGIVDKRVHFIKAGRIGINGRVKNIGLKKAMGGLIAFIDSDDLWASNKLEMQIAMLKQYPQAGFSLSGGYNFSVPGEPIEYFYKNRHGYRVGNMLTAIFKSEVAMIIPTLVFRKECLIETGMFDEKKVFADGDFIIQLARHYEGIVIYDPLFFRRLHEHNDSDQNWEKRSDEGIERVLTYQKEKILSVSLARDAMFRMYINAGEKHLRYKNYGAAAQKFLIAWINKPLSIIPIKKTAKVILSLLKS